MGLRNDVAFDNFAPAPVPHDNVSGVDPARPQVVIMPVHSGGPWGYGWYGLSPSQRKVYFALSVVFAILFIVLIVYIFYHWHKMSKEFDARFEEARKNIENHSFNDFRNGK